MAYQNVSFNSPNMTGDRTNSNFYSFNNGVLIAKQRGAPYDRVAVYPTDSYVGDVTCVQFDNVYYWTLEKSSVGFTIKRWELVSGILRRRDIFSYTSGIGFNYNADSFVVDSYRGLLDGPVDKGQIHIAVTDGSTFNVGDTIVIGPSTSSLYIDKNESKTIVGKFGNVLFLNSVLANSYASGDEVYTTRFFYVFNKYSPYDSTKGSLLKYKWDTGSLISYSSGHMYGDVKASCFYDGRITFVKGHQVIQVNPSTLNVYKHFSIDNLEVNRAGIIPIYALWVYSDVIYRLQNKHVFKSGGDWDEEEWGAYYNFVTSVFHTLLTSVVYFVEVKADPNMIHAVTSSIPVSTSNIVVTVLDQARQPLSGRTVTMSSSKGSISPLVGVTDGNGVFECVYNGTSQIVDVDITATVI